MNLNCLRLTRLRLGAFVALAGLVLAFGYGGVASAADAVDDQLLECARDHIFKYLRDHKYKNVGVLKFQVQLGANKPNLDVGRLNSVMEARLENALILVNDEKDHIGITRGASAAASRRDKEATHDTAEGRAKLFRHKYPLAWGDAEVAVDAFLTGVVKVSDDLKTTTVTVQAFTAERPELQQVASFSVPTNRLLLADLNRGFFLDKRQLTKGLTYEDAENKAVDSARPVAFGKQQGESLYELLEFEVFYDGKPVTWKEPHQVIPTARKGEVKKIHITLKAKERLGLVLLINGVNTLELEEGREPDQYSMWVLEPDKLYTIEGYYTKGGTHPIEVLGESESVLAPLADNSKRGKIELFIYRHVDGGLPQPKELPGAALRATTPRGKTFKDVRDAVFKEASSTPRRGMWNPGAFQAGMKIQGVAFQGTLAGHRSITYWVPPK